MPRSLVLGNGSLLCTFDRNLEMRDLYFPFVGMEDHTTYGNVHRMGFFVENIGFSWVSDGSWQITPGYKLDTLVGQSTLRNDRLGLAITMEDCVHPVHNILLRRLTITTTDEREKVVKCFFNHNFRIYGDNQKDTAFYEPYTNAVIHFREKRYFLVGGTTNRPLECRMNLNASSMDSVLHSKQSMLSSGLSSFSIGKANYRGLEGTWRDAEDGELGRNPIEQGSVDSTVAVHCQVGPLEPTDVTLLLCVGKSLDEVVALEQTVLEETPERLFRNCANYWKSWVNKTSPPLQGLSPAAGDLFRRSLFMMRAHADSNGGILAAADSDIMAFNRDTYTYVWPRDGAFISLTLDLAGYSEVSRRFFEFCRRIQTPDGYLMHKYNPDGSVGSSWHPWFRHNELQLPIQEDETALILVALLRHFNVTKDFEFLQSMYESFIKNAAQFLCDYRDEETGLPLPSYDPWEEHRGIFTYTTATTIAGLYAAAQISQMLGHVSHSEKYQTIADNMKQAMLFHLFDEETQRFVKKINRKGNRTVEIDRTPDASIGIVWKLGVLSPDDPRIISTMNQLKDALTVKTGIGGMARFTNDYYHSVTPPTPDVPGNPWIITTLWDAQWRIARAKNKEELTPAREAIDWACARASSTGLLPEQVHPFDGSPLSVSPLTWSHAVFAETVLLYVEKEKELRKE